MLAAGLVGCGPVAMVRVPAGSFDVRVPGDPPVAGRVVVSTFWLDATEVTALAYASCVAVRSCTAPATGEHCTFGKSDQATHPINCVTPAQAGAYCAFAGKRLPTELEWEYAARGGQERRYPWGDAELDATRLNACGTECVAPVGSPSPQQRTVYPATDGWPATAPVGSFPAGKSPFGALDMAGNVWEITSTRASLDPHAWVSGVSLPNEEPRAQGAPAPLGFVIRGGGWRDTRAERVRSTSSRVIAAETWEDQTGFRCAR